jgi:hypothetical protein
MEHPFLPSVNLMDLSVEELQTKINDLTGKLTFAGRTQNRALQNQLLMVIDSYRQAYNRKVDEMMKKQNMGNSIHIK